jgi:hypothetical protein
MVKGREILRQVTGHDPVLRRDLQSRYGKATGSGGGDTVIFRAGDWCLKTAARRKFGDPSDAQLALVHSARRKARLGSFLAPQTVLAVAEDSAGRSWLWTVSPWTDTLRDWMQRAESAGDAGDLGAALEAYAEAVVSSVLLTLKEELVLDIHPSNFSVIDGHMRYIDDDIVTGRQMPLLGYSVLQRVEEYGDQADAITRYLDRLEADLEQRVKAKGARDLDLEELLAGTLVRTARAAEAKERLVRTVSRMR